MKKKKLNIGFLVLYSFVHRPALPPGHSLTGGGFTRGGNSIVVVIRWVRLNLFEGFSGLMTAVGHCLGWAGVRDLSLLLFPGSWILTLLTHTRETNTGELAERERSHHAREVPLTASKL